MTVDPAWFAIAVSLALVCPIIVIVMAGVILFNKRRDVVAARKVLAVRRRHEEQHQDALMHVLEETGGYYGKDLIDLTDEIIDSERNFYVTMMSAYVGRKTGDIVNIHDHLKRLMRVYLQIKVKNVEGLQLEEDIKEDKKPAKEAKETKEAEEPAAAEEAKDEDKADPESKPDEAAAEAAEGIDLAADEQSQDEAKDDENKAE